MFLLWEILKNAIHANLAGHFSVVSQALVGTDGHWWALVGTGGYWWTLVGTGRHWWTLVGIGGHWRALTGMFSSCGDSLIQISKISLPSLLSFH